MTKAFDEEHLQLLWGFTRKHTRMHMIDHHLLITVPLDINSMICGLVGSTQL